MHILPLNYVYNSPCEPHNSHISTNQDWWLVDEVSIIFMATFYVVTTILEYFSFTRYCRKQRFFLISQNALRQSRDIGWFLDCLQCPVKPGLNRIADLPSIFRFFSRTKGFHGLPTAPLTFLKRHQILHRLYLEFSDELRPEEQFVRTAITRATNLRRKITFPRLDPQVVYSRLDIRNFTTHRMTSN